MLIRNLNWPKSKWDGTEEPTINNFYKLITGNFEYALKIAYRPKPSAVFHINRSRQKYSMATSVLGDSNRPPDTCQVEKNKYNETSNQ